MKARLMSSILLPIVPCKRYFRVFMCWTALLVIILGFFHSPIGPSFQFRTLVPVNSSTSSSLLTMSSRGIHGRNVSALYPRINWTEAEKELTRRKQRLQEMCMAYHNGSRIPARFSNEPLHPDYRHLIIDSFHKLAWCPVFKAASSSWMINFIALGKSLAEDKTLYTKPTWYEKHAFMIGLDDAMRLKKKRTLAAQVRRYFPSLQTTLSMKLLQNSTAFFIVRHPFERLLSAYRDKLENREGKEYYYRKYGQRMVRRFRIHKTNLTAVPTSTITVRGTGGEIGNLSLFRAEPTFLEFLQYIVTTGDMDEHWRPYFSHCSPCKIKYQIVMRFESLHQDQWFLIRQLGLAEVIHPRWRNANSAGLTSRSVAQKYYSQIPRAFLENLYQIYKVDFDLFDYSPDEYIRMGYVP